jgi:hypothetical protein
MQQKSTLKFGNILSLCFMVLFSFLGNYNVSAQNFCANETVLWTEDFGIGNAAPSSPDVINLGYSPFGGLEDGFYRITWNTQQRSEWHFSTNHTPTDTYGNMLVINGDDVTFYTKTITKGTAGFSVGSYSASLFLMNTNTPGTCQPGALLPTISFQVDYNTQATGNENGWVSLQSVSANAVPQSATPAWIQLGAVFNLNTVAQRIRITLADLTNSGCGNDFAIDDIKFATCPSGGPLPVEFLSISAVQKGGGVAVNWSTASESNNKYFDVEKSIDGSTFTVVNSVNAAGNSSTTKNYSSYDAKPVAGYNYYRIKQVDNDGHYKYSSIVKVKINIQKTGVTVLTNPFVNQITVDFLSNSNQSVKVRLTDISGKIIATEKWQIAKGSTRLNLDNVSNIQRGFYIFTVVDDNDNVIYNNKMVKQ